jgi:hypothetical protein
MSTEPETLMTPSVTLIVAVDGRITRVQGSGGIGEPDDFIGRNFFDLIPAKLKRRVRKVHSDVLARRKVVPLELPIETPDGTLVHLQGRAAPIWQDGRPHAVMIQLAAQEDLPLEEPPEIVPREQLHRERALAELLTMLRSFNTDVICEIHRRLLPHARAGRLNSARRDS